MEKRLTLREHLGYGIASMGDSITYVFVGSFLMFFLTTVAGISPASAGVISALGSVFSAVSNPIIGYASDQVYTKYGRRRPALLVFALPLGAVVTLLFTDVPLHGTAKVLYYGIFLLLFWFVYTGFFVPYNALGAAYTTNYDDRTRLRLFASMFNSFGNLISLGAPAALSAFLIARGFGQGPAWTSVGALIGVVAAASLLITFAASKEKDPPVSRPDRSQGRRLSPVARRPDPVRRHAVPGPTGGNIKGLFRALTPKKLPVPSKAGSFLFDFPAKGVIVTQKTLQYLFPNKGFPSWPRRILKKQIPSIRLSRSTAPA